MAVALGVMAVASIGSAIFGRKSRKKSRQASREKRKADLMRQFLQRRKMLQDYRISQAEALTGAVASGADIESSGYQGVRSSLYSQVDYNLRSEDQILGREKKAFQLGEKAEQYAGTAALFDTAANIAGMFVGKNPFGPPKGPGATSVSGSGPLAPIGPSNSISPYTSGTLPGLTESAKSASASLNINTSVWSIGGLGSGR